MPKFYSLPCFSSLFFANSQQNNKEALALILEFANSYCFTPEQKGGSLSSELSVETKAKLDILTRKIGDLQLKGTATGKADAYYGVLQKDLYKALSDASSCRIKVFESLSKTMIR